MHKIRDLVIWRQKIYINKRTKERKERKLQVQLKERYGHCEKIA